MPALADRYGRRFPHWRLSIIQVCNFRCTCYQSHGHQTDPPPDAASLDEITRLLRRVTHLGNQHKLRISGDEPSVRRDLIAIQRGASAIPGTTTHLGAWRTRVGRSANPPLRLIFLPIPRRGNHRPVYRQKSIRAQSNSRPHKAMLAWRCRRLIEHQMTTLRAAGIDPVQASVDRPSNPGIADGTSHAGSLGGRVTIVAPLANRQLIVIPVDMPYLGAALIMCLRDAPADTGCVHFTDHVLSMRQQLNTRVRAALATLLAAADPRSLRVRQARFGVTGLALRRAECRQFIGCNAPAPWLEATA